MKYLIFDIETGPLDRMEISHQLPNFDPASVKMANLKDPEKRAAKLKEAKASYFDNALDKAALNAWSGRVLAIGYQRPEDDSPNILEGGSEGEILEEFAVILTEAWSKGQHLVGFNCERFDLPFMARRSMKLGCLGNLVYQPWPKNYYDPDKIIDLMKVWQCGDRQEYFSLDRLARFFDIEGKEGEVTGPNFWKFYEDIETRAQALEYLDNDVRITKEVAERILP